MLYRIKPLAVVAAVVVALFSLLSAAAAAPRAATMTVAIKDYEFSPKTITANVGDTIVWKNEGNVNHTVTADDGSFESGTLAPGQEFTLEVKQAGTFGYFCKFHGAKGGSGMAGTLTVAAQGAAQPTAQPAQPAGNAPTGSLQAEDQPIANGGITVKSVTAGQDGWVVVHLDEGGKPGKVLGETAVKQGENSNVVVKLSEDVPAGGKLWPMLHIDAGTAGTYEFPGPDTPVTVDGKVVMQQITVTAAGGAQAPAAQKDSVEAENQPIVNGGITVKEIYASQNGWIVVHLDEGGKPGKVLGETAVKQGENNNVVVKLSEDVPVGGKLWPMLHIDAGTAGTYEFPGADTPVTVDGKVVMQQITVTAAQPANLPRTGGEDSTGLLLALALLLLTAGVMVVRRGWRRA